MPALLAGLFLLGMAVSRPAAALSYAPPSDARLYARATTVVLGEVVETTAEGLDATLHTLRIDESFKGAAAGDQLALRVPGALDPLQPGALQVPAAPRLQTGQRVLLFLAPTADGRWQPLDLALGVFAQVTDVDGDTWLRRAAGEGDAEAKTLAGRRLGAFRERLQAYARGAASPPDRAALQETIAPMPKFATSGSPPGRWFAFDQGRALTLYSGPGLQSGLPGGGLRELEQAMQAWNAGGGLRLEYGGARPAGAGLWRADGLSQILFEDPDDELPGVYDCGGGGLIGYTRWRGGELREHRGRRMQDIIEMDIVIQDGAGCALAPGEGSTAAELIAHEIGHGLGLDHPCVDNTCVAGSAEDEALMRPAIHADGRGAALGADDRAGLAFLYPKAGPAPAAAGGGGAFGRAVLLPLLGLLALRRRAPLRPSAKLACGAQPGPRRSSAGRLQP